MSMGHIRLYDLFRKELHLPDDKASDFVVAVGEVSVWEAVKNRQLLVTKNDVHLLKEDVHQFRSELKEDFHLLEIKLERFKVDIYKAIFWTNLAQLLAIFGGVLVIFKFMR